MTEWTDYKGVPLDRSVPDRVMSHTDPRYWPGVRRLWWRFNRSARSRIAGRRPIQGETDERGKAT